MSNASIPLLDMYRTMLLILRFEERCNYIFMQGRIPSTLHLYIGQEAVATGVCTHLGHDDYALSTHRPHGHAIAKGVAPRAIMAELFAKKTGCCQAKGGSMHVGDISVGMFPAIAIVGANIPIAAGVGLAAKRLGTDRVAVAFFGDGAANEGAFHEGLNMASIWDLPVVYVCENNLYAASTPVSVAFRIEDIADRAAAYGMPGVVVDGNDVEAVYEAAGEAIARARRGEGPTLIECKTYRLCGHSRSDPRTYRSKEEEVLWEENDPISSLGERLKRMGLATDQSLAAIEQEVVDLIDEAVAFAEDSPAPEPIDTLNHVFYPHQAYETAEGEG
ncbi:MAG: thiamine pyrophosphate-dependent dehydrogenase E1 component subunit alpha [Anaerolineales bacterium]|nr:MAG: thiamine pyrophosphate-dependent dehydrogenase E1 component subunit alpha [Anaerolineales bacterium]